MGYRGGRQMGLMMNVPTKDYIVETIKEEILSGQIKPGTELAQEALAERLGVSRMPIREALQNLVQEGFAVRLPNRHMQAVVLDREQIHDVFHMIEMMMAENTILLAAKEHRQGGQLTEEDAEDPSSVQLERILKGMKNAPDERRMAEWEMLFHERLISLLGNAYLEQMQKKMLDGYAAYAITHMGDKKESCRRLKEVTEAMAANDDQKIREAFAVYFSSYANAFTSARDEEDKMGGEWRMRMKPDEKTVKLFENDRFATENGAVIEEVEEHYAQCSLKLGSRHRNAMGAVMGGVYFTLADFAFAVAANWQGTGTVSLHSDIAYLGSAKGNQLIAEAVCIKNGRSTSYYKIEVKDELGNLTAVVNTTGYRVK